MAFYRPVPSVASANPLSYIWRRIEISVCLKKHATELIEFCFAASLLGLKNNIEFSLY